MSIHVVQYQKFLLMKPKTLFALLIVFLGTHSKSFCCCRWFPDAEDFQECQKLQYCYPCMPYFLCMGKQYKTFVFVSFFYKALWFRTFKNIDWSLMWNFHKMYLIISTSTGFLGRPSGIMPSGVYITTGAVLPKLFQSHDEVINWKITFNYLKLFTLHTV